MCQRVASSDCPGLVVSMMLVVCSQHHLGVAKCTPEEQAFASMNHGPLDICSNQLPQPPFTHATKHAQHKFYNTTFKLILGQPKLCLLFADLAAQCAILPHVLQYRFEIVSQRGVIARVFALFSEGIAQVSLRYPFCGEGGGVSHLHFVCSPRGKHSEKGEGVSHPIGHVETPKPP